MIYRVSGRRHSRSMVLMAGFMGAGVSVVGMMVQAVISSHSERPNAEQHNEKSEPPANLSLAKQFHNRLRCKTHSQQCRLSPQPIRLHDRHRLQLLLLL